MMGSHYSLLEALVKISMCLACGFVIGLERQVRGKPAGIRTSCLICMSTMLFIYLAEQISTSSDAHARVLAQIVTGVGFLGAGVILTRDGLLHGVTSAAVIWVLAAVGATVGLGLYSLAFLVSFIVVLLLVGVEYFEKIFKSLKSGVHRQ